MMGLRVFTAIRHGGGVRGGRHAADYTHGFCNLHISFHFVFIQDAHCLFILDVVPDIFRGEHVFNDLVLIHAAACLLYGHAGQLLVLVQTGQSHLVHDVVHLLLIQLQKFMQGHLRLFHQRVDHRVHFGFHSGDGRRLLFCHIVFLQNQNIVIDNLRFLCYIAILRWFLLYRIVKSLSISRYAEYFSIPCTVFVKLIKV